MWQRRHIDTDDTECADACPLWILWVGLTASAACLHGRLDWFHLRGSRPWCLTRSCSLFPWTWAWSNSFLLTRPIKVSMSEERPSYPLVSVSSPTQAEIAQEMLTSKQSALCDALVFLALSFVTRCICVAFCYPFLPFLLLHLFPALETWMTISMCWKELWFLAWDKMKVYTVNLSIFLSVYLSFYLSILQIVKVKNNNQRETHSGFRVEVRVWDFTESNGARQFFALPKLIRDWEQTGTWCWSHSAENAGSIVFFLYCNRAHHFLQDDATGENNSIYDTTW